MTRRGMTLLELLVAMTVAVVMLLATAGAFQAATASRERVRATLPRLAGLRTAIRLLQRDLRSLTFTPTDGDPLVLTGDLLAAATTTTPVQALLFTTAASDPLLAGRPSPGLSLVEYEVVVDPVTGQSDLWRHETPYPLPAEPTSSIGVTDRRSARLLPGVLAMRTQFYDREQAAWLLTWERTDTLPAAVWVDLDVLDDPTQIATDAAAPPPYRTYSTIVAIPTHLYQPQPPEEAGAAGDIPAGTTGGNAP